MYVISRRIGFYILTAIAAVTVDFFIPRVMPGNPVSAVLAKMQGTVITKQTLSALAAEFGSNTREGLWGQYLHYWNDILHGNLGHLDQQRDPVPVTTVIRGAPAVDARPGRHGDRAQLHPRHAARRRWWPGSAVAGWTPCCRR